MESTNKLGVTDLERRVNEDRDAVSTIAEIRHFQPGWSGSRRGQDTSSTSFE